MISSKTPVMVSRKLAKASRKFKDGRISTYARSLTRSTLDGVYQYLTLQPSQKYTSQKLSREFSASLSEFQVIQRRALEKQRSASTAARTALEETSSQSPDADNPHQNQQQLHLASQEQLNLASQDEVDFQDSLIVEREGEIRQIEQSVGELNELFRDVATMVREQGENLDMIDANVDRTLGDTRGADLELRSASRYQKSARNKACCLLLILAIVLIIIVLAVVLG